MAKKEAAKKEEKKAPEVKASRPVKKGAKTASIFLIAGVIMAAVFLPSSIVLGIGMLPTFTALFIQPVRAMTKAVTVGALNLAGCVPFLLDLWSHGHDINHALKIVSSPMAIVVMYAAASVGYILDWLVSMSVAAVLYQRGLARQESIRKKQEDLVQRWGVEVTGQVPVDAQGFALISQQNR